MSRNYLAIAFAVLTAACGPTTDTTPLPVETAPEAGVPTPDVTADVVSTLQTLFDALGARDAELLRTVVDPDILMRFTETSTEGETTFGSSTLDGLAQRITTSPEPLIERMWQPVVRVSGSMATIWTPYDFYVGGTFSHCGVDAATLMNTEDGWKIVTLSWTRMQPPACDLHPAGPPAS
jgi:hypothetical protein